MAVSRGLIRRRRTLSAATETTTGTAMALTGPVGVTVYDREVTYEIPENERPDIAGYGNLYSVSGAHRCVF